MITCTIEGCTKKHNARGYCHMHYRKWQAYGDPMGKAPPRAKDPTALKECAYEGCERVGKVTRGFCPTHYMRILRHGTVDAKRGWDSKAHKHSKHPMYGAWQQMKLRCHDPKNSTYPRYGALGIRVCDRWRESFQNFLADMGERPEGMTLDRIDPTGNYEPGNCRWADAKTQRNNLSEAGDMRARAKIGTAKAEYWKRWRRERGLPEAAPTRAEYRARSGPN